MKYGKTPGFILRSVCAEDLLKKYIGDKKKRFIEIGSGTGDFLEILLRYNYSGLAVDFSSEAIEYLKRRFKDYKNSLKIIKKDFFLINEKVDIIIMFEVIEHIKDDTKALKKICSLLNYGGFLLLSTPSKMKNWSYFDIINGHYRRYEKQELIQKIKEAGFSIVEIYSYGWPLLNNLLFVNKFISKIRFGKIKNNDKKYLTKKSGVSNHKIFYFLKFLINKYVLAPFILLQNISCKNDRGTGYIVLAKKK